MTLSFKISLIVIKDHIASIPARHPNSPEKLPLLLTPLTYIHVGNATSRYALRQAQDRLGWPYSGLRPSSHCFISA